MLCLPSMPLPTIKCAFLTCISAYFKLLNSQNIYPQQRYTTHHISRQTNFKPYLSNSGYVGVIPRIIVNEYRPICHSRYLITVIPPRHYFRILQDDVKMYLSPALLSTRSKILKSWTKMFFMNESN